MTTQTIEALKVKHAEELARLEAELSLAQGLPITPERVMLTGKKSAPWVTYKRATIAGALEIFQTFSQSGQVRAMEYRNSGCSVVQPVATMEKQYKAAPADGMEYGLCISVDHGKGYGPNVGVIFYIENESGFKRVCVDIEPATFSHSYNYKLQARAIAEYRGERCTSRKYAPNNALNGYADKVITWGTGENNWEPVKTSARHTYLFINDESHIVGMLGNIAAEFDRKGE